MPSIATVWCFPEKLTGGTCVYVVAEPPKSDSSTRACAIIDPVAEYSSNCGKVSYAHSKTVAEFILAEKLSPEWILETHAHADHISGAPFLKERFPDARIAIGENISIVQETFKHVYNDECIPLDGKPFDTLFSHESTFNIGSLDVKVLNTPGHTPACVTYVVGDGDCMFIGDTLFQPDVGSARCDFPHGDAEDLWNSIQIILSHSPDTRVFVCHDYPGDRREFKWETSVREQLAENKHVKNGTTKEEFLSFRTQRDAVLHAPELLLPSLQCNVRAGNFPEPESNGVSYLKIPLNQFEK